MPQRSCHQRSRRHRTLERRTREAHSHHMSNPQDYYEPEEVDLSRESVCVLDHGVFVEVALRLAQPGGFGTVYYCDPSWEEAFSKFDHAAIGDGFEEIRREIGRASCRERV